MRSRLTAAALAILAIVSVSRHASVAQAADDTASLQPRLDRLEAAVVYGEDIHAIKKLQRAYRFPPISRVLFSCGKTVSCMSLNCPPLEGKGRKSRTLDAIEQCAALGDVIRAIAGPINTGERRGPLRSSASKAPRAECAITLLAHVS